MNAENGEVGEGEKKSLKERNTERKMRRRKRQKMEKTLPVQTNRDLCAIFLAEICLPCGLN